ncbi:MAG: hypothetical protein JWN30_1848, partial [Bacilli bacterium]|nr:hypothetical protein [Bacilli bacterium]
MSATGFPLTELFRYFPGEWNADMKTWSQWLSACVIWLLLYAAVWVPSASAANWRATVVQIHPTPSLTISSYSPSWGTPQELQQIYEELLRNKHGKELALLRSIVIYDGYPNGAGEAGEYHFTAATDLMGHVQMQPGQIDIYGGHDRTTIQAIARTLAHEYGHHVTHFYTIQEDGITLTDPNKWKQTTFSRLRGLDTDFRVGLEDKPHRWQIPEIAAEDYVELFGSPNAKIPTPFNSRLDLAQKGGTLDAVKWSGMMYNVSPQENFDLPLAAQVPAEFEWLNRCLEGNSTTDFSASNNFSPAIAPALALKTVSLQGAEGFLVTLSWNGSKNANDFYTLVSWKDGDDLPEPIATKNGSEQLTAKYGSLVLRKANEIITYKDPNAKGVHHFIVYLIDHNGWTVASNELTLDMDHP